MNKIHVFYPHHLDLWTPIHSIHREVAKRLPDRFNVTCFHDTDRILDDKISSKHLPTDSSKVRKAFIYLSAYLNDCNVVHTGPSPRHYLARLTRFRGASVVHTLHATPIQNKLQNRQRALSRQADVVTAVSPYVRDWARHDLGLEDIIVVPNGVDLDYFRTNRAPTESKTLLYVGRFVERKHPEFVIELAKQLPEWTVKLRVNPSNDVEQTAPSNVEFVERLSYNELADLYSQSACLVCPFEREGFGMVVIEAMASGTPVVGLNDGNLPNLISESNGVLCSSLDVEE